MIEHTMRIIVAIEKSVVSICNMTLLFALFGCQSSGTQQSSNMPGCTQVLSTPGVYIAVAISKADGGTVFLMEASGDLNFGTWQAAVVRRDRSGALVGRREVGGDGTWPTSILDAGWHDGSRYAVMWSLWRSHVYIDDGVSARPQKLSVGKAVDTVAVLTNRDSTPIIIVKLVGQNQDGNSILAFDIHGALLWGRGKNIGPLVMQSDTISQILSPGVVVSANLGGGSVILIDSHGQITRQRKREESMQIFARSVDDEEADAPLIALSSRVKRFSALSLSDDRSQLIAKVDLRGREIITEVFASRSLLCVSTIFGRCIVIERSTGSILCDIQQPRGAVVYPDLSKQGDFVVISLKARTIYRLNTKKHLN